MSGGEVERLRSVLDASGDAIITTDLDGRVVEWNARATQLFGWSHEEVRGRPIASFLLPDHAQDSYFAGLDHVRSTGNSDLFDGIGETTAMTRRGREVPVETSFSIHRDEAGASCVLFLRPLESSRHPNWATRVLAEAMSREDEIDEESVLATAALEAIGQATEHVCGLALRVRGERLLGLASWSSADPDRKPIADLHEGLVVSSPEGLLRRILSERRCLSTELDADRQLADLCDWTPFDLGRFDGVPVVVEDKVVEVVLLLGSSSAEPSSREGSVLVQNVAQQLARLMETQRRDEERSRLAAIVDSSYDAIIGKSVDGRILSWNEGARRVYGYTAQQAVGASISLLLPKGVATEEPKIVAATRSGRRLTEFETWRKHADGREILVSITVSPIKDSRGRVIGASTIERDVTHRRERELKLREAVEAAERANRIKSEFLANVSHELRTPMNAIIGMLDLALGEQLDEVMRDYLDTARDSATTLLFLLNDLLDFSRMEAGRFELDDEPFHLRDTLDAVVKTLSLRAHEKGVELACRVDGTVPDTLRGDGRRLRQVLMNLVGNAIKFTEQGEIVLDAAVESRSDDKAVIRIEVRDTGIGIAEEDQEHIFDAFAQADASSTRQHQGTGLGLAIVRELVHKMGGAIEVESELGKGSTFRFTIRCIVLAERTRRPADHEAAVRELRDLPVLVVDDNATNRTILSEMLENWQMRPFVAASASEAVEKLRSACARDQPFPLVVVDALMPEVDGFDLVERIREERLTERATVLMLSSADRQAFKERSEEVSVDAFLEKPVSQSAMLDVIMTTLRGPQLDHGVVQQIHPALRSLVILVAEDTPANQKVVRSILSKRGHQVHIAHNGREALDLHETLAIDVILMDVQMPTMDGLQATRAIRELDDPAKANVPIIAMTAHAMQGDRERCLTAGMDGYLAKPIDAKQVVSLVEELSAVEPREAAIFAPPATEPSVPASPFDRDVALARLGDDEGLLFDLFDYYREDSATLLDSLQSELEAGKFSEARRAAHSLKGLSSNLEASAVTDLAAAVERLAHEQRGEEARQLLDPLRRAVTELIAAFPPSDR